MKNKDIAIKDKLCIGYKDKEGICKNMPIKHANYCKNCAGKMFEDKVAKIFKIQGYTVIQNIKHKSTQIDIFAKLTYGFTQSGILIECKYKFDEDSSINSEDIRKFDSTRNIFNKDNVYGKSTQALFVTNGNICPEAYEVANECSIELYTYNELINKIIDFQPYINSIINKYENSNLNGHFINLKTTYNEPVGNELKEFIDSKSSEGLVILGDYGSGKSSLVLKLCHDLCRRILKGHDYPIPLLIELREYSKALNMEQLITDLFINKNNIVNGNFNTFLELLQLGKILLVFDGFDEVAKRVDFSVKSQVFNEICKLASKNSKIIITCRTNFFNKKSEFDEVFKSNYLQFEPTSKTIHFDEIELADLNQSQIISYIKSFENELNKDNYTFEKLTNNIQNTHDLMDLAKRPVLLNVIIKTIPKIISQDIKKINAAKLYMEYTKFWLKREDSKGKTLINSNEKLIFTQKLASKMFNCNQLSLHYKDIYKEVKEYFNKIKEIDEIDYFSHDIKSCSFLTRDENGYYSFIHKSFMEYFTAYEVLIQLNKCASLSNDQTYAFLNSLLNNTLLSYEVSLFIYDLLELEEFKAQTYIDILTNINFNKLDNIAYKNFLSILSKTGTNMTPYINNHSNLENIDLSYSIFEDGDFSNIIFSNCTFFNCKIKNTSFSECEFSNVTFKNVEINDSSLSHNFLEYSKFIKTKIINSDFSYSILAGSAIEYCFIKDSNFEYCDFSASVYEGKYPFINCNFESTIGDFY